MKSGKIVLGSGFGDEGKGNLTDFFSSTYNGNCTVVRFSGGANAGHTVVTPDRKRHVFGHIGAGTFTGAKTHLSSYFLCNPALFKKEYLELASKTNIPPITASPACLVTTPYDMAINQMVEKLRGQKKHSSCGVGINETVERSVMGGLALTTWELTNKQSILDVIKVITSNDYIQERLRRNCVYKEISKEFLPFFKDPAVIAKFLSDIEFFLGHVELRADDAVLNNTDNIIFEGSQGLLLGIDSGNNVKFTTNAHTGMYNISLLLNLLTTKLDYIECIYVSRCYRTRHGNGFFYNEYYNKEIKITDETNIANKHQGRLRFGKLCLKTLHEGIMKDFLPYHTNVNKFRMSLAFTCLDQLEEINLAIGENTTIKVNRKDFIDIAINYNPYAKYYISMGPTRETVSVIEPVMPQ